MPIKNHYARRERERKELRLRMLDAAKTLFLQGGERAVTLRRVGEMIEFSSTTIYAYFPNKQALVQELCETEFAFFAHRLQQAEHLPDAMDRLRKIAGLYVDFGLQYPEHYRVLLMREPLSHEEDTGMASRRAVGASSEVGTSRQQSTTIGSSKDLRAYDFLHRAIFKAMAAGCFRAEYRDVALLAQVLWSCLHGVVALHLIRAQYADIGWKPIRSIQEASLENLFNGMTALPQQTPPTWQR